MFRSSETGLPLARWSGLVGLGALALALLPGVQPAVGTGDATDGDRPKHVWVPEPFDEPAEFPTLTLDVQSIDLAVVTEDLDGSVRSEESNDTVDVTLDAKILFGKDSADLRPAARKRLIEVADQLSERSPGRIRVEGHTDDLGSAEHGYDLSRRRAAAVTKVLRPRLSGFDFSVVGKGEDEPRVPNTSEENRQLNRRVEIHYKASH